MEDDVCEILIKKPRPTTATSSVTRDPDEGSHEPGANESHLLQIIKLVISATARLNVLLPTATILAFSIFTPLLTNDGDCSSLNRYLMASFVLLCAASCAFFAITDSFRTASGRACFGVATLYGIWTFNARRKGPLEPASYRLKWQDLFHALMSVAALVIFAGSHRDVVECYHSKAPKKVIKSVPLVAGFVISVLFVIFPSKRNGIGQPLLLQRDKVFLMF
ncbi:protein DMP2 [Dendrobium catenatum]|uniref:Uncharacterized protein n=1 Tax=Dendrobium catenatum TaxID=906689 RepID=A0A2I0WIW0_9ASPA|nr:protein DMP2 [Dendrobium catenatum]PKU75582.1 hypothetical protein MA16_Dca020716 [Dendrobium catenatum]